MTASHFEPHAASHTPVPPVDSRRFTKRNFRCARHLILIVLGLLLATGCRPPFEPTAAEPSQTFVNPRYEGADPFVYKHSDGYYYFCQSEGDRGISVWKSRRLTDKGVKRVVWTPPEFGWNTDEIWAPELHYLKGRWYIY